MQLPHASRAFLLPGGILAFFLAATFTDGKTPKARAAANDMPDPGNLRTLRAAVEDLRTTFGPAYPRGDEYLARLADLERRAVSAGTDKAPHLEAEFASLQREALIANPLVKSHPIVFVVRPQYAPDHHNTETMFQTGEINTGKFAGPGAIKTIDFSGGSPGGGNPAGTVRTLLEVPRGVARDLEINFDGQGILLSMRRDVTDDYHLYEIRSDGAGLRQLTFGRGVTDIDPIRMPDGSIIMSSSREPKYCMCNRHIMCNLFRLDSDGANILQIGKSTLFEGHGCLMPDGTILYDRWEYVDRNFGDAQGLWTCRADGTNHALYYGNNTTSPGAILDARAIPGTGGQRFVATYSSCHDRPWGAIAIVDRQRGLDSPGPELRLWPASASILVGKGNYDTFKQVNPKYEDPYPLAEPVTDTAGHVLAWRGAGKYFLVSRMVGKGEQMGIYLLDVFGNEILLYAEEPGCYDPMPLAPRPKPPTIPNRTDLARAGGAFYVYNVYKGTGMERVKGGEVRFLRVVESPEKRFWTTPGWHGGGTQAPAMNWDDFNNKRILGTVPVEADGSAYFSLPADRFVFFQLLDADGMMIQTMRSGTIVRPGETTGCVGCHEDRLTAVPNARAAAISRAPSRLEPWYGPPREFNYLAEVQPVFDKYCVRCHDYGKPGEKKLLLAGDLCPSFNVSYVELRSRKFVKVVGAGPARILPPYTWGSHASRLIEVIRGGHNDVRLDRESFDRLATWIDLNAPYYPSYASAYPENQYGRNPLTQEQFDRLGSLTGLNLRDQKTGGNRAMVNFTRPALSPCLARFKSADDPNRREAISIIEAGAKALSERPREDMPGARLYGVEADRQRKYERLAEIERQAREAALRGEKRYVDDADVAGE